MESKNFIAFGITSILLVGVVSYAILNSSNNQKNDAASISEIEREVDEVLGSTVEESEENVDNDQAMNTPEIKKYDTVPEMQLEEGVDYKAILKTSMGDITVDLFEENTPITVNNFVFLAKDGFYDGVKFHRIIEDFMIQSGDPEGTGRGGPGYRFEDEDFEGEYTKGTLAMANAGPDTNGSQFFIMHADYPLPPNYVIFGRADEQSLSVVDAIATVETRMSPTGEKSVPVEPIYIESVEIIEN